MIRYNFVEDASPELLNEILLLYRTAGWWPEEEADPRRVGLMITGSHCFFTAMDGHRLVGMGRAISDRSSDAYIQDLIVHPDYRNRGIGTRILKELLTRLKNDGLNWIGLIAERNSFAFYLPFGFEKMPNSTPMLLKKS